MLQPWSHTGAWPSNLKQCRIMQAALQLRPSRTECIFWGDLPFLRLQALQQPGRAARSPRCRSMTHLYLLCCGRLRPCRKQHLPALPRCPEIGLAPISSACHPGNQAGGANPTCFLPPDPSWSITQSFSARGMFAAVSSHASRTPAARHLLALIPLLSDFWDADIPLLLLGMLPKSNISPLARKHPFHILLYTLQPDCHIMTGFHLTASFPRETPPGSQTPRGRASTEGVQPQRCSFCCSTMLRVSEQTRLLRPPGSPVCAAPARLPPHNAPPQRRHLHRGRSTCGQGHCHQDRMLCPWGPQIWCPPRHRLPSAVVHETASSNLLILLPHTCNGVTAFWEEVGNRGAPHTARDAGRE